jgi:lipopolysaccharide cholinephosphotransferase
MSGKQAAGAESARGVAALTPIEGEELRGMLLEILVAVDAFCRERGIAYYLYAGTLLGAVRHQGFIPWDDDVDVMMARADYERFCAEFPSDGSLRLVNPQTHPTFPYACAKVSRVGTLVVEEVDIAEGDRFGVSVDVLPFDAVSDRAPVFRAHVAVAWFVRALLLLKVVQGSPGRPLRTRLMLSVTRTVLGVVPVRVLTSARERIATLWRSRRTAHVSMLIASAPWRVPQAWIAPASSVEFEGRTFPAPANVDGLLTAVYGDYMRPPPAAAQKPPHRAAAYRLEEAS